MTTIEIDRSQELLVVVRFHAAASDEEFRAYLDEYGRVLDSEPRFGVVYVTAANLPPTPPRHVRAQARFIKESGEKIRERVVGVAFALPSPLMRGVLRGVLMLQPVPCPFTVLGTEAEGVAWVKARLWTDHMRRMKGTAP